MVEEHDIIVIRSRWNINRGVNTGISPPSRMGRIGRRRTPVVRVIRLVKEKISEISGRKGIRGVASLAGPFLMVHGVMHIILLLSPRENGGPGNFLTQNGTSWLLDGLGMDAASIDLFGTALVLVAALGLITGSFGLICKMRTVVWRDAVLVSSVLSLFFMMAFWSDWFVAGAAIDIAAIALALKYRPMTGSVPEKVAL